MAAVDASRRGKKMLNSSRDKNEGTYRSGDGGGGPLYDPGSELPNTGRQGESSARIIKGMKCDLYRW